MKRIVVIKWLKIFSISFLILSLIALVDLILLSLSINVILDSQQFNILTVIFGTGFLTFHAGLLWIILLSIFCSFIVLSLSFFKLSSKNSIDDNLFAKFLLLIGLFLIIGGFITMNFIVLLGNSTINSGFTTITFENALFSPSITPVIGAIMWIYFKVLVYSFLISGLIFGGVGLKWVLLIQEEEEKSINS